MEDRAMVLRNISSRIFDSEVLASNQRLFESQLGERDS